MDGSGEGESNGERVNNGTHFSVWLKAHTHTRLSDLRAGNTHSMSVNGYVGGDGMRINCTIEANIPDVFAIASSTGNGSGRVNTDGHGAWQKRMMGRVGQEVEYGNHDEV